MVNDTGATGRQAPLPPETTWFDTVDELLDATIDADDDLELTFDGLAVDVPMRIGRDSPRARWRLDGTVRVSVEGTRGPLSDWLQWWARRTGE
jgi:hypothetical protein